MAIAAAYIAVDPVRTIIKTHKEAQSGAIESQMA